MLSNSRSAAAYGSAIVNRTVYASTLRHSDRLAADDEQVAVRRADGGIQQHLEREHHIVGIERVRRPRSGCRVRNASV